MVPTPAPASPSTRDTDIEHIVARSEAHDSGLCAASAAVKAAFARDLLNLTLASPRLNRYSEAWEGRRRVDACLKRLLVCGSDLGSPSQVRPDHRPCRGRSGGKDSG